MKQKIVLALIALIALLAVIWLATHSKIQINTIGASTGGLYTFQLTGSDGETKEYTSDSAQFEKIVKKDNYTITVKQAGSFFKSVSTESFLQSTTITADLQAESSRSFIGDNPGPCMAYLGNRLVTSSCEDTVYELQEHVAATASLPTFKQNIATNELFGNYKGLVTTKSGQNVLLSLSVEGVSGYFVQTVNPNLAATEQYAVPVSDDESSYAIKPFRNGFIVHDDSFSEILYYSTVSGRPENIRIDRSTNEDYTQTNGTVGPDSITLVSYQADEDEVEGEASGSGSEVTVYRNSTDQDTYTFDEFYTSGTICSSTKLCMTDGTDMAVYDISKDKPKFLYMVRGVIEIHHIQNKLYGLSKTAFYKLNVDDASGFIDYSFGGYQYCGITPTPKGYILCVFDDNGDKSALLLDPSLKDTASVDKKLLELRKTDGVSLVSAFGSFIYIIPDYGDPVYDSVNRINIPDPAKVRIVNERIANAVTKSGIDRSQFTVMNVGVE